MKKIIFLDIDGVLNNQLWYLKTKGDRQRDNIDPENIKFLNTIIKNTGAEVVVTSMWRLGQTPEELQTVLSRNGFEGKVIDKTLDLRDSGDHRQCVLRGNEILCWIQEHADVIGQGYYDFKNYVILDDDSDMLYWQRNNFILVDAYCGLTPNIAYKAINILNQ
jgi:hypothetical protein